MCYLKSYFRKRWQRTEQKTCFIKRGKKLVLSDRIKIGKKPNLLNLAKNISNQQNSKKSTKLETAVKQAKNQF